MNSLNMSLSNDAENTLYFSFDHENKNIAGIKSINKENRSSNAKQKQQADSILAQLPNDLRDTIDDLIKLRVIEHVKCVMRNFLNDFNRKLPTSMKMGNFKSLSTA